MSGLDLAIGILGVVCVASALAAALTRQLVHAALYLVVSLAAVAGCFLVLTAEFLAWVQVLIYVGAVVVLLLFGIMLTRAPIGRAADLTRPRRVGAALCGALCAGGLFAVLYAGFGDAQADLATPRGSAAATGSAIFSTWVLPFEVLSVLLLAALIAAIALSRGASARTRESAPPARS